MIVDAPRDNRIYNSFDFGRTNIQSVPINESGLLVKFFIVARFDHTPGIPSGWPVLQIRRRIHTNDSSYLREVLNTTMEPRPTGYLNVFEYDVQNMTFNVQHNDIIRVFWPPIMNALRHYSLAYFGDASNVMLSIEIDQPAATTLDNSTSTPEPQVTTVTATPTSTSVPETSTQAQTQVAIITGGVLCTLVIIILLVVLIIAAVFVVLRYRNHTNLKDFSLNTNDLKTLPPVLDNPTYSLVDGKFYKSSIMIIMYHKLRIFRC